MLSMREHIPKIIKIQIVLLIQYIQYISISYDILFRIPKKYPCHPHEISFLPDIRHLCLQENKQN